MTGGSTAGHAAWMPPARDPGPTETLPGYDDLVEIGRGGDSVVYRARETALGRQVAVKVLTTDNEARAARFAREVEITLDLGRQHPNIVTVLATGTTGSGRPAIIMEYHEGGTLHDRLEQHGPLPVEEVVRIGAVLADALAFAHERGVLHRDVKPQNVLVLPTSWVLADFGIARLADSEHTASVETFTYRHAAPQILDGHPPTAADDLWSLGSTLHTLVDGRPPFASDDPDDDSALAYLRRARTERPRPLRGDDVGPLAAVIARCLEKDVEARWSSAAELRDALLALQQTVWQPGHAGPAASEPVAAAPSEPVARAASEPVAPTPSEPVVPPPVALSAAGHVEDRAVDDAPTGTGLPREVADPDPGLEASSATPPTTPASGEGGGAEPPPAGSPDTRRRRPVLLLAALAILAGTALGVAGAALRGAGDDPTEQEPASSTSQQGAPIPTLQSAPVDPDPQPDLVDESLRFPLRDLRSDGSTLEVAWRDPSEGEGLFHIVQTAPEENLLARFDPGTTEARFAHPLPIGRSCFVMFVHLPDGRIGQSNQRCLRHEAP